MKTLPIFAATLATVCGHSFASESSPPEKRNIIFILKPGKDSPTLSA